jgi:hypothetical protein
MKTLGQIVLDEFLDQVPQMALAEYDEVIETLAPDGLHKSLGVRIAARTLRWDLHALHARRSENPEERLREQRVSIMDQVRRSSQKSIH